MRCGNAFALPPPIPNQGPLSRGPSKCRPPMPHGAPHGRLRGLCGHAWHLATCPRPVRHLRLVWATHGSATWPQRRVAPARWSRAPHQRATWLRSPCPHLQVSTPFLQFFNRKYLKNSFKNQIKIRKRHKL